MATYNTKSGGYKLPKEWTEPCMNCFASVTYTLEDTYKPCFDKIYIKCPCCGKQMEVHFQNTQLC